MICVICMICSRSNMHGARLARHARSNPTVCSDMLVKCKRSATTKHKDIDDMRDMPDIQPFNPPHTLAL